MSKILQKIASESFVFVNFNLLLSCFCFEYKCGLWYLMQYISNGLSDLHALPSHN